MSKLRKLRRDPLGYLIDSRWRLLRALGAVGLARQRRLSLAAAALTPATLDMVMTVYNTGAHLGAAVQSVAAQRRRPERLIIIDDCSTDGSADALKTLCQQHPFIDAYRMPRNGGTYVAKNWGLMQSGADFVTFHDSDDVSDPDRTALQLGYMQRHPHIMACTVQWDRVDSTGQPVMVNGRRNRMAAISLMIRRAPVLDKVGYSDSVRIAADSEYIARLAHVFGARAITHLRHTLYTGQIRDGSLTTAAGSGVVWRPVEQTGGARHVSKKIDGDRAAYHQAFADWHRRAASLYVDFPARVRPFGVPDSLTRGIDPDHIMHAEPLGDE